MSDYTSQLFSHLATDRLSVFSCGHIIPPQNIQAVILGRGPSGKELEFKFANRGDDALLTELGQLVLNFSSLIPAGMIVFLPSYAFLDGVVASWKKAGVWSKLLVKKKVSHGVMMCGSTSLISYGP
jgi:chromosome transmission fidelity protein 1